MTAQTALKLTAAETAIVALFGDRIARLPGNADVVIARDNALATLKKTGLPTRRIEAWHYTDLRRLLTSIPDHNGDVGLSAVAPILLGSVIVFAPNGQIAALPEIAGANFDNVETAMRADIGAVVPEFTDNNDAIGILNTAFASGGVRVVVDDGKSLETPIEIQTVHDGGQIHMTNRVSVGAGATATFVERFMGSDAQAMATTVTDLHVREGGNATWIIVQEQGAAATHLSRLSLTLDKDARATVFIANYSGQLVREEIAVKVAGEGANLTFRSINMIGDETHCDVTLELDHLVPNTNSTQTVRNVITGKAQGVFQGQIRVAQIAQKTDAQMACNTLLLSDDAGISVKPELEIFADDVICAHGATVAEIDHDHLFYLMARGITEKSARALLVKAFVAELVEELEIDALTQALESRIDSWLDKNS